MSDPLFPQRLAGIFSFLEGAEALKDTLRSGFTSKGRQESTADHTWRLCLFVMMFERELQDVDLLKLLKMCIVHDLGEAISGDVPAVEQMVDDDRASHERRDLLLLCKDLPEDLRDDLVSLWDEYSAGQSPEAIMAKGFDKLETMLQHVKGNNPSDFDYAFNLRYGVNYTDRHPLLIRLREQVDAATRRRMAEQAS